MKPKVRLCVAISALIWGTFAQGVTTLPTTVGFVGTTAEFCVTGVTPGDPYALLLDEVEITDNVKTLVENGTVSLIVSGDGMCLRVENAGFSTSKTLSIWFGDQMGIWHIPKLTPNSRYVSAIDFDPQTAILNKNRMAMAAQSKPGDKCTIDDYVPSISGGGCGGHVSGGNPYPCCDNNANGNPMDQGDGNCTWWAARAAKLSWGFFPNWGGATSWRGNAANDSRVKVDTFRPGVQGVYLDPNNIHVAWATGNTRNDGKTEIEEMNCGQAHYTGILNSKKVCSPPWSKIVPFGYSSGKQTRWVSTSGKNFVYKK